MNFINVLLTFLFLLSFGCSSSENTARNGDIQILNASHNSWSQPPVGNANIPEVGTDLKITVKNWPSSHTPEYIIYNKRKSLSAAVSDTVEGNTVIAGKIIRSSSKLPRTSETVSESDRLVYSTQEGEQHYIEIKSWEAAKK